MEWHYSVNLFIKRPSYLLRWHKKLNRPGWLVISRWLACLETVTHHPSI